MPGATPREVGRRPEGEPCTGATVPARSGAPGFGPAGAGCSEALPPPSASSVPAPGLRGSLAPSCPRRSIPGWAWVRLLTRPPRGPPLPPARTRRLRGRCRPWRAPGPAPSRVAGLRGVGRGGGGCGAPSPHPFPPGAHRPCLTVPTPLLGSSPLAALSWGHPAPGGPAAPFHQDPLSVGRLSSFTSHCPSC